MYAGDIKCCELAADLVQQWNNINRVQEKYQMVVPKIGRKGDMLSALLFNLLLSLLPEENRKEAEEKGDLHKHIILGEVVIIEDYLMGDYVKWNSNGGWIDTLKSDTSIQAFCHWTFHQSGGKYLFCDAQGVRQKDTYVLTDPCILSLEGSTYGVTDMGKDYIWNWFRNHKCNKYCDKSWIRPTKEQLDSVPERVRGLGKATSYVDAMSMKHTDQLNPALRLGQNPQSSKNTILESLASESTAGPAQSQVNLNRTVGKSVALTPPPAQKKDFWKRLFGRR